MILQLDHKQDWTRQKPEVDTKTGLDARLDWTQDWTRCKTGPDTRLDWT